MILPITRRPLFPGFYKTVVIKDPDVIAAIKELARTQQPYVTAVLLKDEEADQDRVSDLDEIYRMGVFCQITNVYHSSMPAAAAVAAGGGAGHGAGSDDGPSLTAILYPHRRVRVKGLVTSKDKVPRAVVEDPTAEKDVVVDSATRLATSVLTAPISDADAPTPLTDVASDAAAATTTTTKQPAAAQTSATPVEDPNEETSPQAYLPSKFNVSMAKTEPVFDEPYKKGNQLIRALTSEIVSVFKDIATLNPLFREQIAAFSVSQASATIFDDPSKLADFAAAVSGGSDAEELQGVLDSLVIEERLQKALYVLKKELVNAQLQSKISKEVETKIQKRQREYYLMEQLKGIKKELGLESDGKDKLIDKFKDRLEKAQIPAAVKTVIDEEMAKLGHLDPASSEFNVTRNYLDWLTCLPWGKHSSEELDVAKARVILDEDHYGLKDVKDRILEFIAVGKLKGTVEGKIICMVGPPGVGKTSIGKSIARALNREFYRFSVGGLSDVAEIKGHRRTYVGAMPGKMVQALKKVQTENPLVLIDEIDKLGKGMQGDPASALLELLDPEQNNAFLDHYLDVPLDLSKVLFVCTANVLETIPAPLLDRMEVIQLSGYVADEKAAIAERYLAPQAKHACGLAPDEGKKEAGEAAAAAAAAVDGGSEAPVAQSKDAERETVTGSDSAATADGAAVPSSGSATQADAPAPSATPVPDVQLTREAIDVLIRYYCRESGVRNLKKHIEKIYRKAAFRIVADGASEVTITPDNLKDFVGNPPFQAERLFDQPPAGVVMGLAWTAMGGSALYIESVLEAGLSRDAKPMFKTTGQLGDVMKESTAIALTYAKTFLAERFKDLAFFEHAQIHLHVPEGAQPKDGPSAGITMTTALISLATRTPVPGDIAMTGELTLTGKVLKIGGLKEKTISAKRSGVKTILFPKANAADWAELPDYIKKGLTGVPVEHYSDVFEACFGEAVKSGEFAKEAWRPGPKEEEKKKSKSEE
ncbi:Lon protease C-terminal proteolytic domain-domain-containing protein [Catenaria anguillulae PL171]|uniref:Lon protease homolog, mitochondrial n=1 Tax=Catenaria anguillulae PL171 TaxID=765915 RepID=A0A1Y2HHR0_9FUNG|nr:Lon protease C-terminal proteolytic domain-domain-containing protein [Catenaria anguillulae PL171]